MKNTILIKLLSTWVQLIWRSTINECFSTLSPSICVYKFDRS